MGDTSWASSHQYRPLHQRASRRNRRRSGRPTRTLLGISPEEVRPRRL